MKPKYLILVTIILIVIILIGVYIGVNYKKIFLSGKVVTLTGRFELPEDTKACIGFLYTDDYGTVEIQPYFHGDILEEECALLKSFSGKNVEIMGELEYVVPQPPAQRVNDGWVMKSIGSIKIVSSRPEPPSPDLIFIEYESGFLEQDYFKITIYQNGNFIGWRGPDNEGIPMNTVLPNDKIEKLKSILTQYEFAQLKNLEKVDPRVYEEISCDAPEHEILINFNNNVRKFGFSCFCAPEKTCEFLNALIISLEDIFYEFIDESSCEQTKNIYYKSLCYFQIAVKKTDPNLCEKIEQITDKGELMNDCYRKIAEKTLDVSLCEKIGKGHFMTSEEEKVKNRCLYDAAKKIKEPEERSKICDQITEAGLGWTSSVEGFQLMKGKEACYFYLIRDTSNAYYCENLLDENQQKCYERWGATTAVNKKDPSICGKINIEVHRRSCYMFVAWKLNDASVCELIEDNSARQACLRSVE